MTYDDCDYYCYGLTLYIIGIIEYPWEGSTYWIFTVIIFLTSPLCGVAQTPDCGMLVIYFISPLCGVTETPDCGILLPLHYCLFVLHINNLLACIRDFFMTDIVIIVYFRA